MRIETLKKKIGKEGDPKINEELELMRIFLEAEKKKRELEKEQQQDTKNKE